MWRKRNVNNENNQSINAMPSRRLGVKCICGVVSMKSMKIGGNGNENSIVNGENQNESSWRNGESVQSIK